MPPTPTVFLWFNVLKSFFLCCFSPEPDLCWSQDLCCDPIKQHWEGPAGSASTAVSRKKKKKTLLIKKILNEEVGVNLRLTLEDSGKQKSSSGVQGRARSLSLP